MIFPDREITSGAEFTCWQIGEIILFIYAERRVRRPDFISGYKRGRSEAGRKRFYDSGA
jgi:hypothetical protein